jgi:hypothetical protein
MTCVGELFSGFQRDLMIPSRILKNKGQNVKKSSSHVRKRREPTCAPVVFTRSAYIHSGPLPAGHEKRQTPFPFEGFFRFPDWRTIEATCQPGSAPDSQRFSMPDQ